MSEPAPDPDGLTPLQARFAEEYLVDLNATEAYRRATDDQRSPNAKQRGYQLLELPGVEARVAELNAARSKRTAITADVVLQELLRVARVDLVDLFDDAGNLRPVKDIPEDARRAIAAIDVDELWEGRGDDRTQVGLTRKVRFYDKTKSLELLGRHLKLFTDRLELVDPSGRADRLRRARERTK